VPYIERPEPGSWRDVLRLFMAGIGAVLLVYAASLCVGVEFVYRHLIAGPMARLLTLLGRPKRE
jgi:hypothetical protein